MSYEDGEAAYNRGDYATARRLWLPLAEGGNSDAQTMLGIMYENGLGVPQDDAAAVTWYRKAADQGEAKAQCNLGFMYYNGRGITRDYGAAATWFYKAAEQGHPSSQFNLGIMYENGVGVAQDYATAASWYRQAADEGHARAEAKAQEADQHAKEQELKRERERVQEEKNQQHEARLEAARKNIDYIGAFRSMLRDVAADALVPLYGSGGAGLIFTAVYSPAEIISGISAAEDAGLSVEEGVNCFVMLSAAVEAELQKCGGVLQRLKAKLPPKRGTRAHVHLAMFNYVRERPPAVTFRARKHSTYSQEDTTNI